MSDRELLKQRLDTIAANLEQPPSRYVNGLAIRLTEAQALLDLLPDIRAALAAPLSTDDARDAIVTLHAERDALALHLTAAEKAAGHSEFASWPLDSTIRRVIAERDAVRAEVERLREALEKLRMGANVNEKWLPKEWVLDIIRAALESKP